MVQRQKQIGIDILSDGEFWKARDQQYFDTRATGIETRPVKEGEAPSVPAMQRERDMPEFKAFWEIYEYVGNTPMQGVDVRGFAATRANGDHQRAEAQRSGRSEA